MVSIWFLYIVPQKGWALETSEWTEGFRAARASEPGDSKSP